MRYNANTDAVEISVEELCTLCLTGGSIDNRNVSRRFRERARDHSKIYEKAHLTFGMRYYDRVEVSHTCKIDELYITVTGYADGVLCRDAGYSVDEIRLGSPDKLTEIEEEHYHQIRLSVYAFLIASAKKVSDIELRHVFVDLDDDEMEILDTLKSIDSLRELYTSMLTKIIWRANILRDRVRVRIPSAANATFPYKTLRESQSEMIKECYRDIKHGSRLFCQAPTGIGKTVSTLFPSVKCIGEGIADKIFYLTSKQSIRREAFSAMERMNKAGVGLRTCIISSRESM